MVNKIIFCTHYEIDLITFYTPTGGSPFLTVKMNEEGIKVWFSKKGKEMGVEVPDFIIERSVKIFKSHKASKKDINPDEFEVEMEKSFKLRKKW